MSEKDLRRFIREALSVAINEQDIENSYTVSDIQRPDIEAGGYYWPQEADIDDDGILTRDEQRKWIRDHGRPSYDEDHYEVTDEEWEQEYKDKDAIIYTLERRFVIEGLQAGGYIGESPSNIEFLKGLEADSELREKWLEYIGSYNKYRALGKISKALPEDPLCLLAMWNSLRNGPEYFNFVSLPEYSGPFYSPLDVLSMTSAYNKSRKHPKTGEARPHLGIDFSAKTGTPLYACHEGEAKISGSNSSGTGFMVEIVGDDLTTVYMHMEEAGRVEGRVFGGHTIGKTGKSGKDITGPHLHLEVKANGRHSNPWRFLYSAGLYKPKQHVIKVGVGRCFGDPFEKTKSSNE